MLATLGLAACQPTELVAPGAAPAIFGNLKIANTFVESWNSAGSAFVRLSLPTAATTLVGTDTTDTLTNKSLTSPTITGTSVVSNRASGNATLSSGTKVITHGLSGVPDVVFVTSNNIGATNLYVVTINSTNFTATSTNTSASNVIYWQAILANE